MSAEGARPAAPPPAPTPRPNPGPPRLRTVDDPAPSGDQAYPPIPSHIARHIGLIVQPAVRTTAAKRRHVEHARAA